MTDYVFRSKFARRIPDPIFHDSLGIERYVLLVRVKDVPQNLPYDPNARLPNIRRRVYKEIEQSLLDEGDNTQGTFHLKHKGITLIADNVRRSERVGKSSEDESIVSLKKGHGIVDGGHTYQLIMKNIHNSDLPENQYVKFEIITKIPSDWITEIAGGLNTSVQVEDMSLDNLAKKFDWIKKELADTSYAKSIAWREGESGEYDARDIVSLMTCFLIDRYPNDKSDHPVMAYEKKSQALALFEEYESMFLKVKPIMKEILFLHDHISRTARILWNKANSGRAGAATFMEKRKGGKKFSFTFTGEEEEYRLTNAALYPMLAAFRWMVEEDPKKKVYRWRGGFKTVLKRWEDAAPELMKLTFEANNENGRTPNALGKSRTHWNNLHTKLAKIDQDAELVALRAQVRAASR